MLWSGAAAATRNRYVRRAAGIALTGGESVIRRIYETYKVVPQAIFVPEDRDLPAWCEEIPTYIIRAEGRAINGELVSALNNDGFAAQFACPSTAPVDVLTHPRERAEQTLVLHRLRIPVNVGRLLRAAEAYRYPAVVLDGSCEPFAEKVIRASGGAVFNPQMKIVALQGTAPGSPVTSRKLEEIAEANNLLPIFTAPAQDAPHAVDVALSYHQARFDAMQRGESGKGAMVLLGAEASGSAELAHAWSRAYAVASLKLDNPAITSVNVSLAGAVLMRYFRPDATAEFNDWLTRGVFAERTDEELPSENRRSSLTSP